MIFVSKLLTKLLGRSNRTSTALLVKKTRTATAAIIAALHGSSPEIHFYAASPLLGDDSEGRKRDRPFAEQGQFISRSQSEQAS
jgi:hypothetical protein